MTARDFTAAAAPGGIKGWTATPDYIHYIHISCSLRDSLMKLNRREATFKYLEYPGKSAHRWANIASFEMKKKISFSFPFSVAVGRLVKKTHTRTVVLSFHSKLKLYFSVE